MKSAAEIKLDILLYLQDHSNNFSLLEVSKMLNDLREASHKEIADVLIGDEK